MHPLLRLPGSAVEAAIAAVAAGEMVVVVDDEDRENEGDLVIAADAVTSEQLAFMVRHTSGVVCAALDGDRCDRLGLPLMVPAAANHEAEGTAFTHANHPGPHPSAAKALRAFTVTVDLRNGTTTGISAADRAMTLRALADPDRTAADFNRPGHVFPLRARPDGVLERPGHTEASVDLARLAGRAPVGVLCELVLDGGGMARLPELTAFADRHGLVLVSIRDLVAYRRRTEQLVTRVGQSRLPTPWGDFRCVAFESHLDGNTHLAMVKGDLDGATDTADVLVRVHRECLTGDVFGSRSCACGAQLREAMRRVGEAERGVVVYLRGDEGRGGADHDRDDGIGAQILTALGLTVTELVPTAAPTSAHLGSV